MSEFNNRYISITKEGANYTTNAAASGAAEVYGEIDDESLMHRYDLLTRQDMSRNIASKSVTGTEYSEGGFNLAAQIDPFLANVMRAFFKDTCSGSNSHVFTEPSGTDTLPSFTIQVGREQKEHTYKGMVGNNLSISAAIGEYVMVSADFVGKAESATDTLQTPSFGGDALDALYFSNGSVILNDGADTANTTASASIKSFSLDISMNRDTDNAYGLGNSTYTRKPPAQRREITGTLELNQVIYGATPTGDDPSYDNLIAADGDMYNGASSLPAIKITLNEESGSDHIEIALYKVRFEAPEANVSGRDTNTMTVNFIALYDAGDANKAVQITMDGSQLSESTAY
tara:strand:+ start:15095 stop:16126 length:1032 start_codon:yes stop_codon:yes gene_type:complete